MQNIFSDIQPFPYRGTYGSHSDRRSTTLDEIPVYFDEDFGGFGDIMSAIKLAQGLQREFPDVPTRLYFEREQDYRKLSRVFPTFDQSRHDPTVDGIKVLHIPQPHLSEMMRDKRICVFTPIGQGAYEFHGEMIPGHEGAMRDAQINFYIQEYDIRENVVNPRYMKENRAYRDDAGRIHSVISTGFDHTGLGLHIDPSLIQGFPNIDGQETLLRELHEISPDLDLEEISRSTWSLAYYNAKSGGEDRFRRRIDYRHGPGFLGYLLRTLEIAGNRKVTIFDFSSFDPESLMSKEEMQSFREHHFEESDFLKNGEIFQRKLRYEDMMARQRQPFRDTYILPNGESRIFLGEGRLHGKRRHDVHIIHLGTQPHDIFLRFMAQSQLPLYITGDASLSEAVSMDKVFCYDAPYWKREMLPHLLQFLTLLANEKDSQILRSVHGLSPHTPREFFTFESYQQLYESLRNLVEEVQDEVSTRLQDYRRNFNYDNVPTHRKDGKKLRFHIINIEKRVEGLYIVKALEERGVSLSPNIRRHIFSYKGFDYRSFPTENWGWILRDHYRDLFAKYIRPPRFERLFFDDEAREAFLHMNAEIRGKMDLAKNLATLIREAVKTFN